MRDGLYKVTFETQLGVGHGVVFLQDGRLRGGDGAIAYTGTFQESGNSFTASVTIKRHSAGVQTVLGVDNAVLNLKGMSSGDTASLDGTTPANAAIKFRARLERIAD